MTLKELDCVVLIRDIPASGLRRGDMGTIVHAHTPHDFEVEFVRASGRAHALLTLSDADVRGVRDEDLIVVRSV